MSFKHKRQRFFSISTNHKQDFKGSSLVDYILPTALIGLVVGMGLYMAIKENLLQNFVSASLNLNYNAETGKASSSGFNSINISAGDLGGKFNDPKKVCKGAKCSIDFGDLVLNNVSDNFASLVETNGNSGGTKELLELLKQVIAQLEADPETDPSQLLALKNLLAKGYEIVSIEEQFEYVYPLYQAEYDKVNNFLQSQYDSTDNTYNVGYPLGVLNFINPINKITNLEGSTNTLNLTNGADSYNASVSLVNINALLNPNTTLTYNNGENFNGTSSLGLNNNFHDLVFGSNSLSTYEFSNGQTLSPMGQFLKELSKINNGTNLPDGAQTIVNALSEEIFNLAENVQIKSTKANEAKEQMTTTAQNLTNLLNAGINGKIEASHMDTYLNPYNNVTDLINSPATETDLDLQLICKSRGGSINSSTKQCEP